MLQSSYPNTAPYLGYDIVVVRNVALASATEIDAQASELLLERPSHARLSRSSYGVMPTAAREQLLCTSSLVIQGRQAQLRQQS